MTVLSNAQKLFEEKIRSNPGLDEWYVEVPGTKLKVRIVLTGSDKSQEILDNSEEGLAIDKFIFEKKEYLLVR